MKEELLNILIIGSGGFVGTICRYLVGKLFIFLDILNFPIATLSVNTLGSFILGFVMTVISNTELISPRLAVFLTIGFCGGFTTFSTFSYDNFALFREDKIFLAILNISLNLLIGIIAVIMGYLLAKKLVV